MSHKKADSYIHIDVDVEELVQDKRGLATYEQIKAYVLEHTGLKVSHLYIAQVKQNTASLSVKTTISRNPKTPSSRNARRIRKEPLRKH